MDMGDGTSAAFVGSHNLTGFALLGLNGEAASFWKGTQMRRSSRRCGDM